MAAHALLHLLVLGAGQGVVRQPRVGVRRALPRAIVVLHGGSGGGLPPSGGGGIGGGGDGGSGGGGGGGSDNDDEKRPFQHGTGGTGAPEGPKRMVPWPVAWAMGMIATAFAVLAAEHLVPGLNVPIFALLTLRSTAPPEKGIWTTREEVEQHFRDYLRNPSEQVLIVAGPKGTGKSTAALHAVRDVRGTAYVSLSGEDKLSKQVLVAVGMPFIERHTEISRPALARMCKAAALLGRRWFGDKTWLPTLLVEIDQTVQPGYIKDAVATLKYLAHDARACRAILVLSDGNAVLGLDPDPARRNHLWMGDFSETEARARMDAAELLVGEDDYAAVRTLFALRCAVGCAAQFERADRARFCRGQARGGRNPRHRPARVRRLQDEQGARPALPPPPQGHAQEWRLVSRGESSLHDPVQSGGAELQGVRCDHV
mmetsp:Transcript_34764/g.82000  ORF Transcript_34764/g.82000 Transcript_34764/m.82000 type:complete len:428 (+) Transcript_34764:44-1327(+)